MRAVVQRVGSAAVTVAGEERSCIGRGLLLYLGVDRDDGVGDAAYLVEKIRYLRTFIDDAGKMNLDVAQAGGAVLVVSAFTVSADVRRGRRPSFDTAALPELALNLYEHFCVSLGSMGLHVARGCFGEYMQVTSVNDGPICLLLDSRRRF